MYINFKILQSNGLLPEDAIILQAIFQNRTEDLSNLLELFLETIEKFEAQGLVKFIKGSKKSSPASLVRLSDKGSRILDEIQIPDVNLDDLDVFSFLKDIYIKEGKEIGNEKATKMWIAQFRVNSGIERNHLAYLCKVFLKDEKEMEWSKRLEYLFWKPANLFQTKFDINQSRLFQYYSKSKEFFDSKFEVIKN